MPIKEDPTTGMKASTYVIVFLVAIVLAVFGTL